jgi:hypothetical protein
VEVTLPRRQSGSLWPGRPPGFSQSTSGKAKEGTTRPFCSFIHGTVEVI